MKLDPTDKPSTVDADGARWVLFKLDLGGRTRRAFQGAASVGQAVGASVGQSVSRLSPEEQILQLIDAARLDQARHAVSATAPSLPSPFAR